MAVKPGYSISLIICCLLAATACFSQPVQPPGPQQRFPAVSTPRGQRVGATEICGNGIDDDGNGLVDDNDFSCYYTSTAPGCLPTKVIWGNSPTALYWINPQTGTNHFVGNIANMTDIAWTSNGRLYAMNNLGIVELDPYTAQVLSFVQIPGYSPVNAMTGDDKGNLFLTAISVTPGGPPAMYVIKYSIATGQATPIVNLTNAGLSSGGDLSFLNGYLYLACGGKRLAAINPGTGTLTTVNITSNINFSAYGLVTLGDGYLYITDNLNLYRVDLTTLQADATPFYTIPSSGVNYTPYGLSTYAEHCNAPACNNPGIVVTIVSGQPYCANPGVSLKATGSGITGESAVSWTLPDGSKVTGPTLLATAPGVYTARYHKVPDDCGHDTSFNLPVIPSPKAYLGKDTLLCQGSTVKLSAKDPAGITNWLWQDGTTTPDYVAGSPGTYTLKASNACGSSTASVQVQVATVPVVHLAADAAICPGESMKLYNDRPRPSWDVYTWSTPSTADTITVKDGAIYWLQSENVCGKSRDSMLLTIKDSCTCFPFYARVALPDDTEMCSFDSLYLENPLHTDGFRYRWQDGSTGNALMAYGPGIYWVDVSTWCGTVRDSIVVHPKQRGCERSVKVPNAFSPSGNGSNEIFRPVITGVLSQYEFSVYNRWGQLLFHTTDRTRGWDGRISGNPQAAGVFVWSCTYRFPGQPVTSLRGTVLLVR